MEARAKDRQNGYEQRGCQVSIRQDSRGASAPPWLCLAVILSSVLFTAWLFAWAPRHAAVTTDPQDFSREVWLKTNSLNPAYDPCTLNYWGEDYGSCIEAVRHAAPTAQESGR